MRIEYGWLLSSVNDATFARTTVTKDTMGDPIIVATVGMRVVRGQIEPLLHNDLGPVYSQTVVYAAEEHDGVFRSIKGAGPREVADLSQPSAALAQEQHEWVLLQHEEGAGTKTGAHYVASVQNSKHRQCPELETAEDLGDAPDETYAIPGDSPTGRIQKSEPEMRQFDVKAVREPKQPDSEVLAQMDMTELEQRAMGAAVAQAEDVGHDESEAWAEVPEEQEEVAAEVSESAKETAEVAAPASKKAAPGMSRAPGSRRNRRKSK